MLQEAQDFSTSRTAAYEQEIFANERATLPEVALYLDPRRKDIPSKFFIGLDLEYQREILEEVATTLSLRVSLSTSFFHPKSMMLALE